MTVAQGEDPEPDLLKLRLATGAGWLESDDGLYRRAAEILMWGDRAWAGLDHSDRLLIAPRITVAAFQVALAAEPAQAQTPLNARLAAVPPGSTGSTWRSAVDLGLEPALPMVARILRLNRYRLAGEVALAGTRALLRPIEGPSELPRLSMLPFGPAIRWLVEHTDGDDLRDHLAALVEQQLELEEHLGVEPPAQADVIAFWEQALPGALILAPGVRRRLQQPVLDQVLDEVLQVALGLDRPAGPGGLAGLLPEPPPAGPARRGRLRRWWHGERR